MTDQREAIAQALLSATWPVTDDLERDSLIDVLLPLVEAAEQRGYEHGLSVRVNEFVKHRLKEREQVRSKALAEARAKITALVETWDYDRADYAKGVDDALAALDGLEGR